MLTFCGRKSTIWAQDAAGGCLGRDEKGTCDNDPQVQSWGNLSVNAGLSEVGEGLPWVGLGAFGV